MLAWLMAFGATLKFFDGNQLKISMQNEHMYMYQKNYKNENFSPSHEF